MAHRLSTVMLNATQEERGTLAALSNWMGEVDQDQSDSKSICSSEYSLQLPLTILLHCCIATAEFTEQYLLSKWHKVGEMSSETYSALLQYFRVKYPHWPIHSRYQVPTVANSSPLTSTVIFFDYVELRGQRFYAENLSGNTSASNIDAHVPWSAQNACGKLLDVFQFQQRVDSPPIWLAYVRWFKPWEGAREDVWDT